MAYYTFQSPVGLRPHTGGPFLSMPKSEHISWNSLLSKHFPWPLCSCRGTPKRQTKLFKKASATVLASWLGMGTFPVHFVKQSDIIKMYLFPALEGGWG